MEENNGNHSCMPQVKVILVPQEVETRITAQNIFFNLRKIDNGNKWKNYVIFTRVILSVELDVLVIFEQPIFMQL